jgi:hypothetical protein
MQKILNDLLTGKDNKTHDIARWSLMFCLLTLVFGLFFNAYQSGMFDLERFYLGSAAIVGAHGAALMMKQGSEPTGKAK